MNPRIFISSTFYDLKYVREDLGSFIESFGFTPIRSESGNIGYTPGEELDESCYAAMRVSDMAILIIGGRYGSPSSKEPKEKDEDLPEKFTHFTSVTRKEFATARQNKIPVFVFIENSVYNEYFLYKKNRAFFESGKEGFEFSNVDNINVMRFIEDIDLIAKVPVFRFDAVYDIKNILRQQWADMFRKYLIFLKQQEMTTREMEPMITQICGSVKGIQKMLDKVSEAVLKDRPDEIMAVKREQIVENAASKIASSFEFVSMLTTQEDIRKYLQFFIEKMFDAKRMGLLDCPFSEDLEDEKKFYSLFEYDGVCISMVKEHLADEPDIFDDSADFKAKLLDELSKSEYLRKMKFIKRVSCKAEKLSL